MAIIIVRCILIYLVALLVIRVMGKRQIAQMQPFELVITLIIADLATIPMSDISIPLINGIIPLLVLCLLHFLITYISCKSVRMRKIFNGKPLIMINPDGIVEDAISKVNITINDIVSTCRNAGYPNVEDVLYVIMETSGSISVIPKNDSSPPTKEEMRIQKKDTELPTIFISDGKYSLDNLKRLAIEQKDVDNFLKTEKTTPKDIVIMTYRTDGNIYLQKKGQKNSILTHIFRACEVKDE